MLIKENKEDLNKCVHGVEDTRSKDISSPQSNRFRFNGIPIKIPASEVFCRYNSYLILKFGKESVLEELQQSWQRRTKREKSLYSR